MIEVLDDVTCVLAKQSMQQAGRYIEVVTSQNLQGAKQYLSPEVRTCGAQGRCHVDEG